MKVPVYIKLLASVAILGTAAGVASLATFASFTSSTSAQAQSLTSGTVSITLGAANRLTVGASNLVPGDTIQRAVDINNNGSAGTSSVGSITLTTTAPTTSLLDSDATNGLQMVIDKCAVIGGSIALSNMSALTAGNTDRLRITLTLPAGASNTLQGQSSVLNYVFTGNQRAATNQ